MNPCPCGYFGHAQRRCSCTLTAIRNYISRISGPIRDRIDLHMAVDPVNHHSLSPTSANESSATIRARVEIAHKIQMARQGTPNAQMSSDHLKIFCALENLEREVLLQALEKHHLSARSHDRILKVARTIADLSGSEKITLTHLSEAISYRCLDKDYFGA